MPVLGKVASPRHCVEHVSLAMVRKTRHEIGAAGAIAITSVGLTMRGMRSNKVLRIRSRCPTSPGRLAARLPG